MSSDQTHEETYGTPCDEGDSDAEDDSTMSETETKSTNGEPNGSQHRLVRLFGRDGFYAVQNWLSWGSVERIVQIKRGLVVFEKDNWIPVENFFGEMGDITVVYLDSFEA